MKHSKAPWTFTETSEEHQSLGFGYRIENKENPTFLAAVNGISKNETCKANAKLIAAAPKLLENLLRLIDRVEECDLQDYFPSAYRRAKDAVKELQ